MPAQFKNKFELRRITKICSTNRELPTLEFALQCFSVSPLNANCLREFIKPNGYDYKLNTDG